MSHAAQTTCYYCHAPLPVAAGVAIVECLYCKTKNDLRERAAHAKGAPRAPKKRVGWLVALGLVVAMVSSFGVCRALNFGPVWVRGTQESRDPEILEFTWVDSDEFSGGYRNRMRGSARITSEGEYQLRFSGFPRGSRWRAGDRSGIVDRDTYAEVASVREKLAEVPIAQIRSYRVDPETTVFFETNRSEGSVELEPITAWLAIRGLFEQVEDRRPVTFENDPEPGDQLSLFSHGDSNFYGPAQIVGEIDLVAFEERLPEVVAELHCEYDIGEPTEQTLQLLDTEVRVYDRRTAELVASKRFSPEKRCPRSGFGNDETFRRSARRSPIEAWLREFIDEPRPE